MRFIGTTDVSTDVRCLRAAYVRVFDRQKETSGRFTLCIRSKVVDGINVSIRVFLTDL